MFSHPRSVNGCSSRSGAANQLGTHERSASERGRLSVTTRLIRRHCQRPCHAVDTPVLLGLLKLSNQVGEACVRTSLQLRTLRARRYDVFAILLSPCAIGGVSKAVENTRNKGNTKHNSHGHSARLASRHSRVPRTSFRPFPSYPVRNTLVPPLAVLQKEAFPDISAIVRNLNGLILFIALLQL